MVSIAMCIQWMPCLSDCQNRGRLGKHGGEFPVSLLHCLAALSMQQTFRHIVSRITVTDVCIGIEPCTRGRTMDRRDVVLPAQKDMKSSGLSPGPP